MVSSLDLVLYLLPVLLLLIISIVFVVKQHKTNKHLNEASQQLFSLLSVSKDAMMLLENDNKITYMNDAMATLLKVDTTKELLPESDMPNVHIQGSLRRFKDFISDYYKPNQNELTYYPQIRIETRNLGKIAVDMYLGQTFEPATKKEQLIVVIRDLRETIKEVASGERDHLTLLPNRSKSYKDFQILCSKHHLKQEKMALLALSIDDFQVTQSILGHEQAEKTILAVAHELKQLSVLHGYHLYHLTYSNFLLIFPKIDSTDDILHAADGIKRRITLLYEEHKSPAYLTTSIGIATSPESGPTVSLFSKVHQALIEARKYGLGNIHLYKKTEASHSYDESALQHDIQYAIERKELMIYYQPIIDAKTRKIVAAEALMRWKHPEHGLIPPFIFIPIMEKTGFIVEAGKYLIKEVIHQQAKWKHFSFDDIVVSLNASMREIENSDYIAYISLILNKYNVPPSSIKVEITESLSMSNIKKMLQTFTRLNKAGISLSLDDFGTGYTSFSYLTQVPASTLKIDKTFIDNILEDKKNQQVVKAIIEVGHSLDMTIVAEGIETAKVAKMLTDFGCDYLQGYYFSKPVPTFEMQGRLRPKKGLSNDDKNIEGRSDSILPVYPV